MSLLYLLLVKGGVSSRHGFNGPMMEVFGLWLVGRDGPLDVFSFAVFCLQISGEIDATFCRSFFRVQDVEITEMEERDRNPSWSRERYSILLESMTF